jgi:hypothetical protein
VSHGRLAFHLIVISSAQKRQGFSHREADEKSLLDEAFRRGTGERRPAHGESGSGEGR